MLHSFRITPDFPLSHRLALLLAVWYIICFVLSGVSDHALSALSANIFSPKISSYPHTRPLIKMKTDFHSPNDRLQADYDKLLIELESRQLRLNPLQKIVDDFNAAKRAYWASEERKQLRKPSLRRSRNIRRPPPPLDPIFLEDFWDKVHERNCLLHNEHQLRRAMVPRGLMQKESPANTTELNPSLTSAQEGVATCADSTNGNSGEAASVASIADKKDASAVSFGLIYENCSEQVTSELRLLPGSVRTSSPPATIRQSSWAGTDQPVVSWSPLC